MQDQSVGSVSEVEGTGSVGTRFIRQPDGVRPDTTCGDYTWRLVATGPHHELARRTSGVVRGLIVVCQVGERLPADTHELNDPHAATLSLSAYTSSDLRFRRKASPRPCHSHCADRHRIPCRFLVTFVVLSDRAFFSNHRHLVQKWRSHPVAQAYE